jgi:putative ABC transport system permease protein
MIRFLIKGLLRDRARSLLPFTTVVLGSMLTVLGYSWLTGMISDITEATARFTAGHVKIMSRAYASQADEAPNDLAYVGVKVLLAELPRDFPGLVWTPRIKFGGLVDIPDANGETRTQGPAAGLAVDLLAPASPERRRLNLDKAIVRGRLPEAPGEILVADAFATRLGIGPGSTATLISATMYGEMAVRNFTVAGTIRFGVAAMDRGAVIADIRDIRDALDMNDAAGEILGFFRDSVYPEKEAAAVATRFNAAHRDDTGDFAPVMETLRDQGGLSELLDMAKSVYGWMLVGFILVMSIVLWNSGLMGSLRRYGEFGIRLALGEDKGRLYRSLIAEGLAIGFIGSVAGTAVGLAGAYYLQAKGVDIGAFMKTSSIMVTNVVRAHVTPVSWVVGFIPGLVATFLGRAVSGIGIYKRQTATLAKEFEG